MTRLSMGPTLMTIVATLAAGCGGRGEAAGDDRAAAAADAPMAMQMPSLEMMAGTRAFLDSLLQGTPEELSRLVTGHRSRIEPMLTAMDRDMAAMNMQADAAWQSLADSVRADLAAAPGLQGEALLLRMRAHAGRMRRLLERHERMMMPGKGMR